VTFGDGTPDGGTLGSRDDHETLALEKAGRHYEAAERCLASGDLRAALDNLVRVRQADPRYRRAAREAVRLAAELDVVELRFEHFLSAFIAAGPEDEADLDVFHELAQLYARRGFEENAEEALEKLLARAPDHPEARETLGALRAQRKLGERTSDRALMDDLRFWSGERRGSGSPGPRGSPGSSAVRPAGSGRGGTEVIPALQQSPFSIGATVAGRYRIDEEIGRGGMGTVFRAWDMELGEDVALKVFTQGLEDGGALDRFRQEIRLSRRLNHRNIVRLHDIGLHQGFRYISMELLVGETLARQLGEPLDTRLGILYLLDACAGLQAAHDLGIIHRDVKPANLFVTTEGVVKVMDFGIAKQQATPGLTMSGMVVGTPTYMAPEQIRGATIVTPALDLYSVGVVGYEMFTGSPPFRHQELLPVLMMHLQDQPDPPRRRNPAVPEALEAILLRLLEKQPERRYPSCQALSDALTALLT
jgi:serine/threonine-protein kinase